MTPDLSNQLGRDSYELVTLAAEDQTRTTETINEHHRTTLTVRGFALTAVAALIVASFVSDTPIPAFFAVFTALYLSWIDYHYSGLYHQAEQTLQVLKSLDHKHRRLLVRHRRTQRQLTRFKGDLRAYNANPPVPTNPGQWIFIPLYCALVIAAGITAWQVSTRHETGAQLTKNFVRTCDELGRNSDPATRQLQDRLGCQ
jgi:hypothetical protein